MPVMDTIRELILPALCIVIGITVAVYLIPVVCNWFGWPVPPGAWGGLLALPLGIALGYVGLMLGLGVWHLVHARRQGE